MHQHTHTVGVPVCYPMSFTPSNLRAELARLLIRDTEISKDTGIPRTNISLYKNGKRNYSHKTALRIARAVNERAGFPVFLLPE